MNSIRGHEQCRFTPGQRVRCDRCKNSFILAPAADLYCTPEGDHACEPCLLGGTPAITIVMPEGR